jgi:nucleoside-diphosphate-sugar epimerase
MKTLVVGATGFIGSAFLRQDLKDNIEIVTRHKNLNCKKYKTHVGDLNDKDFLKHLTTLKFEKIIDLAWEGLPNLSKENNKSNLNLHLNLIKTFAKSGTNQFDIAGSCLEYGDYIGKASEDNLGDGLSDFAITKLQILNYLKRQQISYRWFRIFYAYGPGQHRNSLLVSAYLHAKNNKNLVLINPNSVRDFVFIEDVALAISKLTSNPSANGVYNVGSGSATKIVQMVAEVYEHFDLEFKSLELECKENLTADISRINQESNWMPRYSIAEGVESFVKWAKTVNLS